MDISQHIERNHIEICRFTGLDDVEYGKVASALRMMATAVSERLRMDQKLMLLNSLRFDRIDARQMHIKAAHTKTCKWLLRKSEYLDWLDATKLGEHHGFLWIKGKPGAGKSTLMNFALAHARETMKDKIIISFFFHARGDALQKSTLGTYQSLLLQLLERLPALQFIFDSLDLSASIISTNYQWSVESLKTLLQRAILSLGDSSVVCFIDALDECEERQIRDMISFLEDVGKTAVEAGIRFRVCLSSRHYPRITFRKGLNLVLERQEGHKKGITTYLDTELKIEHSDSGKIRAELQEKASGVFMWVVLVVEILNKEHDDGRMHAIRRRLRDIPGDLHELFRDILTRDSANKDDFVLCIQWLLFARQPLSPEQLYFAILSGVEPEALSRWDRKNITRDVIDRFILSCSKGLTEITTSQAPSVQLIHGSVKDFFLKEIGLGTIWPELGSNFHGQSHERLKHCCLNYMNIGFSAQPGLSKNLLEASTPKDSTPEDSTPEDSNQEAAARRDLATRVFPFLEYAIRNVLHHADVALGSGIHEERFIRSFPFANWIKLKNLLEKDHVHRYTENVSLLYVLAEGNMSNLIRIHPSNLSYLEVEGERYGPPLFAALATGGEETVRTFVETYATNLSRGSWLHKLCSQYCQSKGSRRGFGRGFWFSGQRTVLSYLAELGDEVLFALALEIGKFIPDLKDEDGRTPLYYAAANGHSAVVKLLLERGQVDANWKDDIFGRTLLSWAAESRCTAVIKLLLEMEHADVDSKDDRGQTPLSLVAEWGHEPAVKILLETGRADVNSKDNLGRTPLSWAAEKGHKAVVKLLLETGYADVNLKHYFGGTPLLCAIERGHEAVVKLLLETGHADVNSKDNRGWTPLTRAAEKGCEAIAKVLLDTGQANVNPKDNRGWTPLRWAVEGVHERVVKLLLDTGHAEVNSKDDYGQTPLTRAVEKGYKPVVKLLLDTGQADVDSKDVLGRTLLC